MKKYHPLIVTAKHPETRDSLRIALDVPPHLHDEFAFQAGQHLPVQIDWDGRKIRRTYSICSMPGEWPLQIGVRIQPGGCFSEYAVNEMSIGDRLMAKSPNGQFHVSARKSNQNQYAGFVAGSGITPLLSIVAALLQEQSRSRFTLFYSNRTQGTTMFVDDLYALKNRYPDRLQLHFLFSREEQEFEIAAGRMDETKVRELLHNFCRDGLPDEAFICGPDTMIDTVAATLLELGLAEDKVHAERFGAKNRGLAGEVSGTRIQKNAAGTLSTVSVILDGHQKTFQMRKTGTTIVDAAAENGIELPYSCKGGVCATCRTHVRNGEVEMASNYGLEPWEIEQGFVLACQCSPKSDEVLLDYDKT